MDLILTKTIQDTIKSLLDDSDFYTSERKEAKRISNVSLQADDDSQQQPSFGVSYTLIRDVSQYLNTKPVKKGLPSVHELLQGSGVYFEPKKPKEKNPEFEAYMDRLRAEQQEREYAAMVSSAVQPTHETYFRPDDIKEMKSHLVTIANIGFSMVAVYVAVYMASRTMLNDLGLRVLLSLAGAFAIGIVETILYVNYTHLFTSKKSPKKLKKATKKTT
ncbi:endoplasmic reticulum-based factor for assembly of V-ATPase-domain-containing protein [Chlamydoabsidia padenii]|nr:endoplasmic reticulum-based factor for assembly of V-ATPase-domain-containing protein [Chlamydoabsidia padenii]